jgi:hypothetical protein
MQANLRYAASMRNGVLLTSLCQGLLALAAIVAVGAPEPELVPVLLSLAGSAMAAFAAFRGFQRYPALTAAGVNALAIASYCLVPVIFGGEYREGFAFVAGTGLIVLVVGPPAINAILLLMADQRSRSTLPHRSPTRVNLHN